MKPILFISDLHLSEKTTKLNQQFRRFLTEKALDAEALYILGDFFDYWLGDDLIDPWALSIAKSLQQVANKGVKLFFLAGNRDFLVGKRFLKEAGCIAIDDPTMIELGEHRILLKHGDDLCVLDKKHQLFRKITRNFLIKQFFLVLPAKVRKHIACYLRRNSGANTLPFIKMQAVESAIVKEMKRKDASVMIHGHTHRPMIKYYDKEGKRLQHIVLPDWGNSWGYLCYNIKNKADCFKLVIEKLE